MKKFINISKNQISSKGVQSLADRPNANAQYGVGGLSSTQLKLWFDKLASFLAEKINELQNTLASDEAADYIRIPLEEHGVGSLRDLVNSLEDGDFANKMLYLYPSVSASTPQTMQAIINGLSQSVAETRETIKNMQQLVYITSIDIVYDSPEALPSNGSNDSNYLVINDFEKAIYNYNDASETWDKKQDIQSNIIYVVLEGEKMGFYRYIKTPPYLISAECDTLGKATKYVDLRIEEALTGISAPLSEVVEGGAF